MKITITAKVQVTVTSEQSELLEKMMQAYCDACNYVANYIYQTHNLKQFSLNKKLYRILRNRYKLKSQMAQSVLKTVIARYKTILENQRCWIKPNFKKPQYDLVWNKDYSITQDVFSVNTLSGRVKLSYFEEGMQKYFNQSVYYFSTAKLVRKHGKYFLHIPVTQEVADITSSEICHIVGIDRGINFVVATYNSKQKSGFVSGKAIKQKRAAYKQLRRELQQRHTSSAKRRLKAIGGRENRWMQDVNHCVSKALVENNPKHTLFVLEDLSGIRAATECVRCKDRYVFVSWSFFDLEQKLEYKVALKEDIVIKVDPRYTSQTCPVCGHIAKTNRDKKHHIFRCKACGYQSNDDRIGAMNLYRMGISYLIDSQVPDTVASQYI